MSPKIKQPPFLEEPMEADELEAVREELQSVRSTHCRISLLLACFSIVLVLALLWYDHGDMPMFTLLLCGAILLPMWVVMVFIFRSATRPLNRDMAERIKAVHIMGVVSKDFGEPGGDHCFVTLVNKGGKPKSLFA